MDTLRPNRIALVHTLLALNKPYLTLADLEKVLRLPRPSLYVTLNRLVQYGVLTRLRRGAYQIVFQSPDIARIANSLVYPSYLSFESALSRHGILSQTPYVLTFATTRRPQHLTLGEVEVQYHHLKEGLFFGYTMVDELYLAESEKALLDQAYLASRGLGSIVWDELALSSLDAHRLRDYARAFPAVVRAACQPQ